MNLLANARSPYLRHAAGQKIQWHPWSAEPFDKARQTGKPVFLSSGAAWCHWCHVMASESFEDEKIADLLNAHFICIKLDRDERPDVDRRYQQAVAAMGSGSGWPLSVFLTPDKKPFFGGTYFPPEDRQGRPGLAKVLMAVSTFYRDQHADAASFADEVMNLLRLEALAPSDLDERLLADGEAAILSVFDHQNGGFGSAPKFPMPGALEFLMNRYSGGNQEAGAAARKMLDSMAAGGFHDQLGGGFHRYSVDEAWTIPHFEKMADDNAGLLMNYSEAYALFRHEPYRKVAQGILRFCRDELADPAGGFYASQDADVTVSDEGGYFTWTESEMRETLTPEEFLLVSRHFLHKRGRMHHDPSRYVLTINQSGAELAQETGLDKDTVEDQLARGISRLLSRRKSRTAPFIDRSLYTSLNGMLIAAFFRAFMVFGDPEVRGFGVKSLDRLLRELTDESGVSHCTGITGVLDDYVHTSDALLGGYEATGNAAYLNQAEKIMEKCRSKFKDHDSGGFFDTEEEVLGTRLKKIEDVPHPSANAVAVRVFLKLFLITGKDEYKNEAEQCLRIFAETARSIGVHGGGYFASLSRYYRTTTFKLECGPESDLAASGRLAAVGAGGTVSYGPDNRRVIPCRSGVCAVPVSDPEVLAAWRW